ENKLSKKARGKFRELVKQRAKGLPVAYLTAEKEFFGRKFHVNPSVLIPRPETEQLVELVLQSLKNYQLPTTNHQLLDLGTGSGCIAITLAAMMPIASDNGHHCKITASDISPTALNLARWNAKLHKVKIKFVKSDLFKNIKGEFDIIVANLPYVPAANYQKLKKTLRFEPKIALTDGTNIWRLYDRFFRQLPGHIKPRAKIFLEIDPTSKNRIIKWAKLHFPRISIKFHRDLNGKIRYVMLTCE
ncbi:MAG: peptide chain release factor N(5)-glutamine methyltransferase, partial [bacterium]|nr:peptide chain release factor N(5)-glutamine methyltransferase [bacterium]